MKIVRPTSPEEVRQSAQHTLYVEGNERSIDYMALNELFDRLVNIKGMGPRSNVSSVAKALHADHPYYYFLVDRDAQTKEQVEHSWANFPDTSKHNLLIWPRKEIENYFIDPVFITKSEFFKSDRFSIEDYTKRLQEEATKRVYCEAANRVIIELRESLKASWIECFQYNDGAFATFDDTKKQLLGLPNFQAHLANVSESLHLKSVEERYDQEVQTLLGGSATCVLGTGQWMELMSGKELLHTLVHSAPFFHVLDANDRPLQGSQKLIGLVKSLIRRNVAELPADFQRLKQIVEARVRS